MGLNIGTCATSLISSIGTSYKAKRVAVIHFSIKVIGTLICLPLYLLATSVFQLEFVHYTVTPWNIAMVHTVYNLAITALLMPFTNQLVKLGKWLVKAKEETAPKDSMQYAPDLLLLRSPSVALQECDHYTFRMAATARESLEKAMALVGAYNETDAEVVLQQEDTLDLYEDRLDTYLVYLSAQALSQQDSRRVGKMQHAIGDFERLGDHAVNLVKAGKELEIKSLFFSEEARRELGVLSEAVRELGGDIWFNCRAERFLFEDGRLCGVETNLGTIPCHHVLANINADIVYGRMVPPELVPEREKKLSAARNGQYGGRMFTAYFCLDKTPEELGIRDYCIFMAGTADSTREYRNLMKGMEANDYCIFPATVTTPTPTPASPWTSAPTRTL